MSDHNVVKRAVLNTGQWTSGIAQGSIIAIPPLLLLSLTLGVTLMLSRNLITMFGKGGLN